MGYYLGIDLGGTNIGVGIIDETYRFVAEYSTFTQSERGFGPIIADMAGAAVKALEEAGLTVNDIPYVGIGVPSSINPVTNRVVYANNLQWKDEDVIGEFRKHLDIPIFLANDADAAALGEAVAGAAKAYTNVMMLTLGTGVGGSIILDKHIFAGGDGYGCEPGHSTVVMDGRRCTCGRKGCLEAYASVTALIQDTRAAMEKTPHSLMHQAAAAAGRVDGRTSFDAAKQGDEAAMEVVKNYIHYLAVGISSFETLFRPEVVLLGGGVANQGDYLIEPLRKKVHAMGLSPENTPEIPILHAVLGNNAGIIGAALLGGALQSKTYSL